MKKIFIFLVVSSFVLYVATFITPYFWGYTYTATELDVLSWSGYGAMLDTHFVTYLFLGAYGLASIGLILFKPWAKILFLLLTISSVVTIPFWGMFVQGVLEGVLAYVITLMDGAILTMLYLTSISEAFKNT